MLKKELETPHVVSYGVSARDFLVNRQSYL